MTRLVAPFSPPPSQLPRLSPRQGVRKFTVEEYHKLIEDSFFAENEKFELVEGWIVNKMSRNPPHDVAIDKTHEALQACLPKEWRIRIQSGITTADSEPEPDLAVVLGPADRYLDHHPEPFEIAMVVESSYTSLDFDRADKGRVYAVAGVPVYWILNVVDAQVEVYTDPSGSDGAAGYRVQEVFTGEDLVPLMIAGKKVAEIPARQFLP